MRQTKQAELAHWLAKRDRAETRQERIVAEIRVAALRSGLRLVTAAERWREICG